MRWLTFAFLLAACGGQGAPELEWTGTPGSGPMTLLDWTPEVEVTVDGEPHPMVLDTGAPYTSVDREAFADRIDGLEETSLGLLGIDAQVRVSTFDLFGPGGGPTDGLLGADVLGAFAVELDYRGARAGFHLDGTLVPAPEDTTPVELMVRMAGGGLTYVPGCGATCGTLRIGATRVLVPARMEGRAEPVWALIDTGASGVLVRDRLLAELDDAEVRPRPRLPGLRVATVGGVIDGAYVRVWRVALGDAEDETAPVVAIDDVWAMDLPGLGLFDAIEQEVGVPVDVLIGGSFLRAAHVVIDEPASRMRLAPYATLPHVPDDEFVLVGFTMAPDAGGGWLVDVVVPGSDAAAEGLVTGDRVGSIGDTAITGLDADAVNALLEAYGLGDVVPITITPSGGVARDVGISVEDLLPSFPPPG